jgi:hypothetical protein
MIFAKVCFRFLTNVLMKAFNLFKGRHDIQHNDILHNDTQHKGLICDIQHKLHSA